MNAALQAIQLATLQVLVSQQLKSRSQWLLADYPATVATMGIPRLRALIIERRSFGAVARQCRDAIVLVHDLLLVASFIHLGFFVLSLHDRVSLNRHP